jgi:DNA-directed RNA polymerase subunit RPC12/RpoP
MRPRHDPPTPPIIRCPYCNSEWFREAGVDMWKEQTEDDFQLARWGYPPDPGSTLNHLQPRIRVCLCGAPYPPTLGGACLGGRTPNVELSSLMKVFRELNSQLAWERDANGVLKECVLEEGVEKGEVVSAAARLRPLEVKALRQLRHQSPASVKGLRKPWKKIRREPETPNGRDEQVLALQEKGFTYRMAREIVDVIVRVCVEGLQRDKTLGTPLGWFKAVPAPPARQAVRFGKKVTLYKNNWRVRFTPDPALCAGGGALQAVPEVEKKRSKSMSDAVQCPECGSEWLMLAEFRRYQDWYSAYPGGEIDPVGRAVFPLPVCLCGHPLSPTKISQTSSVEGLRDFLAAVKAAQKHRDTVATIQDPDEVLEEVLERVATKPEVEQLLERIRQLEAKGSIKK